MYVSNEKCLDLHLFISVCAVPADPLELEEGVVVSLLMMDAGNQTDSLQDSASV